MSDGLLAQLDVMNKRVVDVIKERDDLLKQLRLRCKHLRLVELQDLDEYFTSPPRRICIDCGAEEDGWYCGYHVLALNDETWNVPHKEERVLVEITSDSSKFYSHRKRGPLYLVGQNHPNFSGGGYKTYKQLTEIL